MDAAYYRRLARELITNAASQANPVVAARLRKRAHENLLLAEALDDDRPPQPPRPETPRPALQQQQIQPAKKKNEDEPA